MQGRGFARQKIKMLSESESSPSTGFHTDMNRSEVRTNMRPNPTPITANLPTSSCVAQEARSLNLFSSTPLIYSIPLSKLCHPRPVFLKLDLLQPSGSFKDRGMAYLIATVNHEHKQLHQEDSTVSPKIKLIASSGGNAGLGVATVARSLPTVEVSVIVPETTKPIVINKLRSLGAEVTVYGQNWNSADTLARQRVGEMKELGRHAVYVRYVQSTVDLQLLYHFVF